jgi:hypothetical protein
MKSKKQAPVIKKTLSIYRHLQQSSNNHIVVHGEKKGYAYKIFWREEKGDPIEVIGSSPKTYKTKAACVTSIKKLKSFFIMGHTDYILVYDDKGRKINTELRSRYIF